MAWYVVWLAGVLGSCGRAPPAGLTVVDISDRSGLIPRASAAARMDRRAT